MQLPTIHHNGTAKPSLIDALCAASAALDAAYNALKQTAPNGRDFYPQGPDAIRNATEEHLDRLRRVDAVKSEIDRMAIAIDEL